MWTVATAICTIHRAQWIRQTDGVKGINIKKDEHKVALFADDILMYLTEPSKSFPKLFNLIEQFVKFSIHTKYWKDTKLTMTHKLNTDIARWDSNPFMILTQRIESIKMYFLPRTLYMFQALPVEITPQQFNEWDTIDSRFIWQGKQTQSKVQNFAATETKRWNGNPRSEKLFLLDTDETSIKSN